MFTIVYSSSLFYFIHAGFKTLFPLYGQMNQTRHMPLSQVCTTATITTLNEVTCIHAMVFVLDFGVFRLDLGSVESALQSALQSSKRKHNRHYVPVYDSTCPDICILFSN